MKNYSLYLSDNIEFEEVYKELQSSIVDKKTLYIIATQNLKRLRLQHPLIKEIKNNEKNKFLTFSELKDELYKSLRDEHVFLSRADQKFILNQVIKVLFQGDRFNALYNMRGSIFELFEFLLSQEVFPIENEVLCEIHKNFTEFEKDIFLIYNKYFEVLQIIKSGNVPSDINVTRLKIGNKVRLLSEVINTLIYNTVDDFDVVVFDGFLFFNDEQMKLLEDSVFKGKDIIFLAKQMKSDKEKFLLNKLFIPLQEELNIKLSVKEFDSGNKENENAITYVKNNYLDFYKTPKVDIENGFNFYEPFTSRDRELASIVNTISKYLKSKTNGDRKKIEKILANDICVVIANNKEKYEQQLNVILRDYGVFFLNAESDIYNKLDTSLLEDVIYSKNEFLESRVRYKTGKILSLQEKMVAFKNLYKGINISQKARSFINYPIGQYILEIYKIVNQGINCEGFKKILYSNWYYNIGLDTVKYDVYIKDFSKLEPYLRKKNNVTDWIKELEYIISYKDSIKDKLEYRFNPINTITLDSLNFFLSQLKEISRMIDNLTNVFGDINEHLKALKYNFAIDDVLENEGIVNEFETEIIGELKKIIEGINKSNLITNIDSKYFSDNIHLMLMDYERELAESEANNLTLNIVNLENMQKFKVTYFCMCEEDKYPRPYILSFPFDENIIEILTNPKYGIEKKPRLIKSIDYHLELEKYLFLNVLDFTSEQVIITQAESENGKELTNSIYIEDIFSMFDSNIEYRKIRTDWDKSSDGYEPIISVPIPFKEKEDISLTDFCSYFLCPKVYYYLSHKAMKNEISYDNEWRLGLYVPMVIMYKTLLKFGLDGKSTNKCYHISEPLFYEDMKKYYQEIFDDEMKIFDFISNFDKKDIKKKIETGLNYFVKKNILDRNLETFSFDLSDETKINIINDHAKQFKLVIDSALIIKNHKDNNSLYCDISSNIDYLVKSSGGEFYGFQHFEDIVRKLNERNVYDDRAALINSLYFKLNTQLQNTKFKEDGLKRIRGLSNRITTNRDIDYIPSSYCKYCKFQEICKTKDKGAL